MTSRRGVIEEPQPDRTMVVSETLRQRMLLGKRERLARLDGHSRGEQGRYVQGLRMALRRGTRAKTVEPPPGTEYTEFCFI